jgi:hypothetical protein
MNPDMATRIVFGPILDGDRTTFSYEIVVYGIDVGGSSPFADLTYRGIAKAFFSKDPDGGFNDFFVVRSRSR